jgi:hypothetical protein
MFPIDIVFRGMDPSESIEAQVHEWAEKLAATYPHIVRAQVALDLPHRHHVHGRRFHVRILLSVPGRTLVITGDPGEGPAHEDAHVALRDAFRVARRQLAELGDGHARVTDLDAGGGVP